MNQGVRFLSFMDLLLFLDKSFDINLLYHPGEMQGKNDGAKFHPSNQVCFDRFTNRYYDPRKMRKIHGRGSNVINNMQGAQCKETLSGASDACKKRFSSVILFTEIMTHIKGSRLGHCDLTFEQYKESALSRKINGEDLTLKDVQMVYEFYKKYERKKSETKDLYVPIPLLLYS